MTALLSLSYMGMMLRCIHGVGGACERSCEVHTVSMLRCIHGVGGDVNAHVKCIRCRCYVAYMGNVHVKCIRCRGYVAYMGWGGMLTKSIGRNSGVRQNLGFTQKNFASHFQYSTVVPGCHALALAALCMDVVLETQDFE